MLKPKNSNEWGQYLVFKEAVIKVLSDSEEPMPWNEIKEIAGLEQANPRRSWVRRLEEEIGLTRRRKDGEKVWSLRPEGTSGSPCHPWP
ncbi:hypothetical protein ES708_14941 [subsurface metagenome]